MWNVLGLVVQRMTFAVDNNDNVAGKNAKLWNFHCISTVTNMTFLRVANIKIVHINVPMYIHIY